MKIIITHSQKLNFKYGNLVRRNIYVKNNKTKRQDIKLRI